MKKNATRALVAALTLGSASLAQAVPLYFDFTGTVTQESPTIGLGTAVSGGFTLETDRMAAMPPWGGIQYNFLDWSPTGLTEPLAFIDYAGLHREVPGATINYASINFADGCQPVCNTGWSENFNVGAYSQDAFSAGFTGQYRTWNISLYNIYQTQLPDYPYFEGYDAFNGADMTPLDTISLPLAYLDGTFYQSVADCIDGVCSEAVADYFVFRVDTLERGVGARSVPEPGTLGLFGAAFAGMFFLRRRRPII